MSAALTPEQQTKVRYCTLEELFAFLEELDAEAVSTEGVVRGRKVKTRFTKVSEEEKKTKMRSLAKVFTESIKRLKKDRE